MMRYRPEIMMAQVLRLPDLRPIAFSLPVSWTNSRINSRSGLAARPLNHAELIDKLDGAGYGLGQCANRASPTRGKGNIPPVFV